jgi:glycosyltransferase involved in cell wall biosynthesis
MTVLISVTYYEPCREYVERAVRSVLAQTHRDLVCVVIGDGAEPPLAGIRDERLIVHSYPENRGAYFAQDVAILASPFEWYAPVAADDWVDPDHIARHVELNADMACGALWYHNDHYPEGIVVRKAYEVGMYRTKRYLEIGAHNPAERLGQDSLTLKVMRIVRPVGATSHPTYHRLGRAGSLSTHPATRRDSPARQQMRRRNRAIVARCLRIAAMMPNLERRAARIREYRATLVPAPIRAALEREVDGLRSKLGQEVAA